VHVRDTWQHADRYRTVTMTVTAPPGWFESNFCAPMSASPNRSRTVIILRVRQLYTSRPVEMETLSETAFFLSPAGASPRRPFEGLARRQSDLASTRRSRGPPGRGPWRTRRRSTDPAQGRSGIGP